MGRIRRSRMPVFPKVGEIYLVLWERFEGSPVSRDFGNIGVELWLVSLGGGMMRLGLVLFFF